MFSVMAIILFISDIQGEVAFMWLIDGLKRLSFLMLFCKKAF